MADNAVVPASPAVPAPAAPTPASPAQAPISTATRNDLDADPRVLALGNDVLRGVPPDQAQAIFLSFRSVPGHIRNAVHDNFASVTPTPFEIDDRELERIVALDHGKILAAEWGRNARRNFAVAEGRFQSIAESLSTDDAAILLAWWRQLPPLQKAAVVRATVAFDEG